MTMVFFHLCDDSEYLLDKLGREMPIDEVPAFTLRAAREMIADDALSGLINMSYGIEVRDSGGASLHTLYFKEAVEIVGLE